MPEWIHQKNKHFEKTALSTILPQQWINDHEYILGLILTAAWLDVPCSSIYADPRHNSHSPSNRHSVISCLKTRANIASSRPVRWNSATTARRNICSSRDPFLQTETHSYKQDTVHIATSFSTPVTILISM